MRLSQCWRTLIRSHSYLFLLFVFNPWHLYILGVLKIIIITSVYHCKVITSDVLADIVQKTNPRRFSKRQLNFNGIGENYAGIFQHSLKHTQTLHNKLSSPMEALCQKSKCSLTVDI